MLVEECHAHGRTVDGQIFRIRGGKKKRERENRKNRKVFPPVCRLKIGSSLKSSGQILGKVKFSLEIVMR